MKQNTITTILLILILAVFCGGLYYGKEYVDQQNKIFEQNQIAMQSKLQRVETKTGQIESRTASFVSSGDIEVLRNANTELYNELKRENGEVKSLIMSNVKVSMPDTTLDSEVEFIDDSTYILNLKNSYSDSGMKQDLEISTTVWSLKDTLKIVNSKFVQNDIRLNLVLGHKKIGDTLMVFARSPSKYVSIDSLSGYSKVDLSKYQKTSRFVCGPYIGVGYSGQSIFPTVGVGVTYNIMSDWQKIKNIIK